jgi:hypothetical protein
MNITEIIAKYSAVDQSQDPKQDLGRRQRLQGRNLKLDIFGFDNYIFSIGVFKEERQFGRVNLVLDHVLAPVGRKPFPEIYNTLTFAVDPKYKDYVFPNQLVYQWQGDHIILYKIIKSNGSIYFYNHEFNIALIFIDEKIDSQYYTEARTFKSFKKTFKCIPDIIINGHRNYWVDLYYFISYLINTGKKVSINNWAFLHERVSLLSPMKLISIVKNEYFEFFPELGFILNIIAITNPNFDSIHLATRSNRIPNRVFIKHNPKLDEWLTAVPQFANPFIVRAQSQQATMPNQLQLALVRLRQLGIESPKDEPQQGYAWQDRAP